MSVIWKKFNCDQCELDVGPVVEIWTPDLTD